MSDVSSGVVLRRRSSGGVAPPLAGGLVGVSIPVGLPFSAIGPYAICLQDVFSPLASQTDSDPLSSASDSSLRRRRPGGGRELNYLRQRWIRQWRRAEKGEQRKAAPAGVPLVSPKCGADRFVPYVALLAIAMGASKSRPEVIQKFTKGGENERIKYAVSNMEDTRRNKKDTFAAFPNLDDLTSFFGVYDGHGEWMRCWNSQMNGWNSLLVHLLLLAIELTTIHKPSHQIEAARIENAGGRVTTGVELPGEADEFFQQRGSGIARINGTLDHARAIGIALCGLFAFKHRKDLPPEEQMVTCDPELHTIPITPDIEFLLIVSDGIW
ncbi:hypothetical protein HU200_008649 [Digitaria exilis]|uniref:protein-serine/threonine phosphatase n=1 Tax=Digitaria exilis TaxID=1010633 RepID=A0A835FNR8_9POAL|nr:hypothetical protein HU200_008649 [Digitaria exilis]